MSLHIAEAVLLSATLSADALTAGFAYGAARVKIAPWKAAVISLVCSTLLGLSLLLGAALGGFVPEWLAVAVCFAVLFVLGMIKLFSKNEKEAVPKALSALGAVTLAAALSLDGLAAGFGTMGSVNTTAAVAASLILNFAAVLFGSRLGEKTARKRLNLNWLAGAVLIALAVSKLF